MPRSAASDLDLRCLPMSHKKDARLIWVNLLFELMLYVQVNNFQSWQDVFLSTKKGV